MIEPCEQNATSAFCPGPRVTIPGAASGRLAGLTFAAKDVFDVAGHVTGAGNPDWAATHDPASATAPAVTALVEAGASLLGKTITDELTFSMEGRNRHYGTPPNPRAPGCVPGGSSSGSASAVASGLADFALGTDTAGSIRIPASFCGLHGLRPTWGRVSSTGVVPLAPEFDAVGWMARDARVLEQVGAVLLRTGGRHAVSRRCPSRLIIFDDAFAGIEPKARARLDASVNQLGRFFASHETMRLADLSHAPGRLDGWTRAFAIRQGFDVWRTHGGWVGAHRAGLAPAIARRFDWAASITPEEARQARDICRDIARFLDDLLADDGVLCLPSTPGCAPLRTAGQAIFDDMRKGALKLVCAASIAGAPQITLPVATIVGRPLGLGLMGPRGGDEALLELLQDIWRKRTSE